MWGGAANPYAKKRAVYALPWRVNQMRCNIYIYDNLESAMSKSMIIGGGGLDSSVVDDSEKSGLLKRWLLFLGGRRKGGE
jgi:hypothetical protein